MAYENVRPFYVDTTQFDNALSGLFSALKKKREDEAYGGLLDSLTGGAPTIGNALSAPSASSVSTPTSAPSVPPVLQAGYGRESGGPAPVNALAGNRSAPAAIRYNNPGAMWPGPSSQKFGAVGSDVIGGGNKIAIFKDPESGAAAQFDLFARKYAGKPLGAAIAQWSGGNSSPAYTATIAKAMGMDPNTVITPEMMRNPQVAIPLAKAMAKWESGRDFPLDDSGWQRAHRMALGGPVQGQGQAPEPNAAPSMPQVADASGGQDQARLIAWARANPGHPMAQAITKELVGQRLDPTQGIKLQQAQIELQNAQRDQQLEGVKRSAMRAQAVLQMQPGPARDMAWKQTLALHMREHPGDEITPEEADPTTGPQLMMAQAGAFLDTQKQDLERRKTEAEIKKLEREAQGKAGHYGLNPIYGRDKNGNIVPMQLGSDGQAIQPTLPNGIQLDLSAKAQEQAAGKERGEAQGQGQVDLQRQTDNANLALNTINSIRSHPGKSMGLGWTAASGMIPNSNARGFANLVDQAKGQVFLQAFNSLRGGGAITDAEGAKATQALARLDRYQSEADFDAALKDLEDVINAGLARAQSKAKGVSAPSASVPSYADGLKSKYGLE